MLIVEDVEGVLPLKSLEDFFILALKGTAFAVMIHCFYQFVVERWALHSNGLMVLKKANLFFFFLNPFFLRALHFFRLCRK